MLPVMLSEAFNRKLNNHLFTFIFFYLMSVFSVRWYLIFSVNPNFSKICLACQHA